MPSTIEVHRPTPDLLACELALEHERAVAHDEVGAFALLDAVQEHLERTLDVAGRRTVVARRGVSATFIECPRP